MAGEREELIRQRAYALWERGGGEHGRHEDHWAEATREIDGKAAKTAKRAPVAKTGKTAAAKPAPARTAPAKTPPNKTATKEPTLAKTKPAKAAGKPPAAIQISKRKGG